MIEQFAPGVYYPAESLLHRLRARTKLLALAWLVGYATAANQLARPAPYIALVLLALLAAACSGVGAGPIWRRMRWLVLLTLLGTLPGVLLLEADGAPLFAIGPLAVTYEAVALAVRLLVAFLALYLLALLLTLSTSPVALIEGLTLLLGPLRRLRLPVDAFALMALLALRFIPTLADEVEQLVKAQLSRGASFTHGSLAERRDSLAALIVPVYTGALRRAAELAEALDARGFRPDGSPTRLHERPLARADYLCLAAVLGASLAALLV
ncbi:energy-coupling factor transporter transmembrane component T family protein [Kouleothrix sp.]|uniref:energy-coupling factor transporter transmembrane component T family protein n=1 Tax=Kouleothrix sp. TaxID=2779161 RepID=UPI00391D00E1